MYLTTRVKLVLAENPEAGIQGVKVSLFDQDIQDDDDFLTTGITDARGEIFFRFDSKQYTDAEDQPQWKTESLPDLFIIAYDASGKEVFSSRSEAIQDKLPRLITIPFKREQAVDYGWIPK